MESRKSRLILFDVDGTLCKSGCKISGEMIEVLNLISHDYTIMILGGGTYEKIKWQIGPSICLFDLVLSENGIMTYNQSGELIYENNIRSFWGDAKLNKVVENLMDWNANHCKFPKNRGLIKTGKFIDLRKGLIYFCPIGASCTAEDRANFVNFDEEVDFRLKMIADLRSYKSLVGTEMSLGGQLGISISPVGWDKSFVKNIITIKDYNEIFFFGDKLGTGGSDAPVKKLTDIVCLPVANPDHTLTYLRNFKNHKYEKLELSWVIHGREDDEDHDNNEEYKAQKSRRKSHVENLGIIPLVLDHSKSI